MELMHLLDDPTFQNWVTKSDRGDYEKWQRWRAEHPEHAGLMDEAAWLLNGITFERQKLSPAKRTEDWEKLRLRLDLPGEYAGSRRMSSGKWWIVAASLVIFMLAGYSLTHYQKANEHISYQTGFGEVLSVGLPDSSLVTLNANSTLTAPVRWKRGTDLEVTLSGEAFFSVTRKGKNESFTVSSGGTLIRVLGTSFDVNTRHALRVSLVEGKVEVDHPRSNAPFILTKGQSVQIDETTGNYLLTEYGLDQMLSWKEGYWVFDDTPVREVFQRIQDDYGLTCISEDENLLKRHISGKISLREKAVLLKALSILLDTEISEAEGRLIFKSGKTELQPKY